MSLVPGRRRKSSRVTDKLADVCRGRWSATQLSPAEADEFLEAARLHRIAPLAQVVTRDSAPDLSERLRPDRHTAMARNMVAPVVLGELGRVLDGLPWLTFKGATLSATAHPRPGLRTFMDIDALVSPADLREACRRLGEAGWHMLDMDDMLAARPIPGEMHWVSPWGVNLDLHWSMINREARRNRFSIRTDELIQRRRTVSLGDVEVPTLDLYDALVHVCVHSSLDGANRLLQLVDADGLARQIHDWRMLADRARRWRAGAQVWLVLNRARQVMGTPLPDGLAGDLAVSAGLRALLGVVDRAAPVAAARSEHGLPRLIARALHSTLVATTGAVTRNAIRGVRDRLRPPPTPVDRVPATSATLSGFLAVVEAHR